MASDFARNSDRLALLSVGQSADGAIAQCTGSQNQIIYQTVGNWIASYLMSGHPELGRAGDVCPFTAQASRLDTIRIGVSDADGSDVAEMVETMRFCCQQLRAIPCPRTLSHFKTVIVAFPKARGADGLKGLKAAQARLRTYTLLRGLMIGRFYDGSDDPGLWNPNFRPLQSPVPLLVVRHLVVQDAPFVICHPALLPTYLLKFPLGGARRLLDALGRRRASPRPAASVPSGRRDPVGG